MIIIKASNQRTCYGAVPLVILIYLYLIVCEVIVMAIKEHGSVYSFNFISS